MQPQFGAAIPYHLVNHVWQIASILKILYFHNTLHKQPFSLWCSRYFVCLVDELLKFCMLVLDILVTILFIFVKALLIVFFFSLQARRAWAPKWSSGTRWPRRGRLYAATWIATLGATPLRWGMVAGASYWVAEVLVQFWVLTLRRLTTRCYNVREFQEISSSGEAVSNRELHIDHSHLF